MVFAYSAMTGQGGQIVLDVWLSYKQMFEWTAAVYIFKYCRDPFEGVGMVNMMP